MPNEIEVQRINQVVSRTLRMREPSPAGILGAEVVATLPIEVDRPEWRALGGTYHYALGIETGSVAGEFSNHVFFNPANSRVLAVVTFIDYQPIVLTDRITVFLGLVTDPAGASAFPGFVRDQRCFNRASPFVGRRSACGIQAFSTAGVPAGGNAITKGPATITQRVELLDQPDGWLIIAPGTGFRIIPELVTNAGHANFTWYERELLPSEQATL